jgi:hypothetical protein
MTDDNIQKELKVLSTEGGTLRTKDKEESLIKSILPWFSLVGVVVAVFTFFTNANLRRKEISCTYLGASSIVHIDRGSLQGPLSIFYRDVPVNELFRTSFVIQNTGSSAIKAEDIKEPVQLVFPRGYQLLSPPSLDDTSPHFSASVTADPNNSNILNISFVLLNPGDQMWISANAIHVTDEAPKLIGRIVEVKRIKNVDASKGNSESAEPLPHLQNTILRKSIYYSLLIFNFAISAFFLVMFVIGQFQFIRLKIWTSKWADHVNKFLNEHHKDLKIDVRNSAWDNVLNRSGIVKELRNAGLPKKPSSFTGDWGGYFAMSSTFLVLFIFPAFNFYYVFSGPAI